MKAFMEWIKIQCYNKSNGVLMTTYQLTPEQYEQLRDALGPHVERLRGRPGDIRRMGSLETNDGENLALISVRGDGSVELRTDSTAVMDALAGIADREQETVEYEAYDLSPEAYERFRRFLPEHYRMPEPRESEEGRHFTWGGHVTFEYNKFTHKLNSVTVSTSDPTVLDTLHNMRDSMPAVVSLTEQGEEPRRVTRQ
jgi:hypothetical protein